MSHTDVSVHKSILVVGGGIAGITTAVEAAEVGYEVFIVEKEPYLGGRVTQLAKYFPKLCLPNCGLEINFQRIKNNPRIRFFTTSEVQSVSGGPGNFDVTIRQNPRFVNDRCTACNDCVPVCPEERADSFNLGMGKTKAIYLPHPMAFPMKYAIDLNMQPKTFNLNVGAIVVATGWKPYDAPRIDNLSFR